MTELQRQRALLTFYVANSKPPPRQNAKKEEDTLSGVLLSDRVGSTNQRGPAICQFASGTLKSAAPPMYVVSFRNHAFTAPVE